MIEQITVYNILIYNIFSILGKRYRVVIISTVRTHKFDIQENLCMPQEKENGFFSNKWLVNAAISCARSLVMVFGDLRSLLQHGDCRFVRLLSHNLPLNDSSQD